MPVDLIYPLLGIAGGAVAGFVTSYYFWDKDRRRDRPRLVIEAKASAGQAIFRVSNTGFSYAEKIVIQDMGTKEILLRIEDLRQEHSKDFVSLNFDESQEIQINFEDVWGKKYSSSWQIDGPRWVGGHAEGDTWVEPHTVARLEKENKAAE